MRGPSLGGAGADKVPPAGQETLSLLGSLPALGEAGRAARTPVCGLGGPALPAPCRSIQPQPGLLFRGLWGVFILSPPPLLFSWRGDVEGRIPHPMWDEGINAVVWGSPRYTALLTHGDVTEGKEGSHRRWGAPQLLPAVLHRTQGHSPVPPCPRSSHSAGLERCRRGAHPGGVGGTWLQPRLSW